MATALLDFVAIIEGAILRMLYPLPEPEDRRIT